MSAIFHSKLLPPLFCDDSVTTLFTDENYLSCMLTVEAALAKVEAELDVIPKNTGLSLAEKIPQTQINIEQLSEQISESGVPLIPLLSQIRQTLTTEEQNYLHWGATTQDIMDTACVIQLRAALTFIKEQLTELNQKLGKLADTHRHTVMAAHTHGQQALPTSFGLKAANWLAPLQRHLQRLNELEHRLLIVQFGGAAGTQAALGDKGIIVMQALAEELGLYEPVSPWHAQRDSLAELAGGLSLITTSLAKMAQDIILMAQTELGEISETGDTDRGGSSSMPQKQNPIISEQIIAAARTNISLLSSMHHACIQEHERATHGWQIEWLNLPQMLMLSSGALKNALLLAANLQVHPDKMRENISRANDQIMAEAIVFCLCDMMPRQQAQQAVKESSNEAKHTDRSLLDVIRKKYPGAETKLDELHDPANYLGSTNTIIDRILAQNQNK